MELDLTQKNAMQKAEDRGGMLIDFSADNKPIWICYNKHRFNASMKQIANGVWCTECTESIGERALREYLEKKKVRYQQEKTFPGLRDRSALRYDFWLTDYDLAVEVDGEFHFKKITTKEERGRFKNKASRAPKGVPNAAKRLLNQIEHDIEKDNWCKETRNSILRIPFWQLVDLEKIIDEKITEIERDRKNGIKNIYYWCTYSEWRNEAVKSLKSKGKNKIPMPKSIVPRGACKKTWENRKERVTELTLLPKSK